MKVQGNRIQKDSVAAKVQGNRIQKESIAAKVQGNRIQKDSVAAKVQGDRKALPLKAIYLFMRMVGAENGTLDYGIIYSAEGTE